mgnify:CR=1 FL=1
MALESEFLRSCLEKCQITAADLDNLSRRLGDPEARENLRQARQSLNDCLKHCEFAYKLI